MQHNFKEGIDWIADPTGATPLANHIFVSKSGNDTTGDGSPGNPYLTIAGTKKSDLDNYTVIVGAGFYNDIFGENSTISKNIVSLILIADGNVVLNGASQTSPFITLSKGNPVFTIKNFTITNWSKFIAQNGNRYTDVSIENCLTIDTEMEVLQFGTIYSKYSVHINSSFLKNTYYAAVRSFEKSIFINSRIESVLDAFSCHFDSECSGNVSGTLTDYNNIEEGCSISFHVDANLNSISVNPLFKNVRAYDFSVFPESQLLGAGKNGENIGNVYLGASFSEQNLDFKSVIDNHTNLKFNSLGEIIIIDPENTTTGISGVEVVELNIITFDFLRYIGKINLLGVTDFLNNVPDVDNEANPNFLSLEMRWAMLDEDILSMPYYMFRWNMIPTVNFEDGQVFKTNAEHGFDWNNQSKIIAKQMQLRVTFKSLGEYIIS